MVKPIMKDIFFLAQKSVPATQSDIGVIVDLLDTLRANSAHCVGLAANMIGVKKRIIAVNEKTTYSMNTACANHSFPPAGSYTTSHY